MNSHTTTWEELVAFLRLLVLHCCRGKAGLEQPQIPAAPQVLEAEVDRWLKTRLTPDLRHPIPQELRWLLLRRARAALAHAGSAMILQVSPPPASLPRMLQSLLLEMAGKLPVPELRPDVPPWLE